MEGTSVSERLHLKRTIPLIVMLVSLKCAFSWLSMIQVLEYLFVLASIVIALILPMVQKTDYILDLDDKESALDASKYLALFMLIEYTCLKALPLLTKIAIMTLCHYDLDFEVLNDRSKTIAYKAKGSIGMLALRVLLACGIIALDALYLPAHQWWYLAFVVLQIANYLVILKYTVRPLLLYSANQKPLDMLKVKWLSALVIGFIAPVLVFVANQTPDYHILRFNSDPVTITLLLIATGLFLYLYVYESRDVDACTDVMRRLKPGSLVLASALVSSLVLTPTQSRWPSL